MTDHTTIPATPAAELDAYLRELGGCSDGHCIIIKPIGMHTNGGCRCARDEMKMRRVVFAYRRYRSAMERADV
ncbi:hypothetical protein [Phenylobacterium sp. J367]|uniref:hypothetical protein n=1 Tax=Phenylobacterium sp. J367 TaxID=2898435 RepID=UPI002151B048|nr:hypothetical protein [Phenylobacterium sp. J367]MCR5876980.1 hypothetical protein [Phenylobacterium sp. J367]MCR5881178.1 hypothetical protein [Phenylobacterium sp. J367]